MLQNKILTQKDAETYARLTAPQHIKYSHFSKHEKIEGYHENRGAPGFMGSDRLLKADSLYGTIQMGYNPKKGQSFLFANIKTSVFDTAPSRHQKELKEYQMARVLKTGTQNVAYTAKRRGASALVLYKAENQPWSPRSVKPYLRKANMEALRKTMPFLDKSAEVSDREGALREHKLLHRELAEKMTQRRYGEMAVVRARQRALLERQSELSALIYRKDAQGRLFFRKLNYALDIQKREMFDYYRNRFMGGAMADKETGPVESVPDEDKDE